MPGDAIDDDIIGESAPLRRVRDLMERVSTSDSTVLIMGESGTGKELVARGLHERSARRDRPFVALNCSAIPETLIESELFGHVKGAFTDARAAHAGLFVDAHGGTLFLDEIAELPLSMQPKLLRALQERAVRPVGGAHEVELDVRVVAATNRDLEEDVRARRFRQDLYYRVNVVRIDVPPLRDRGRDVLLLARRFVARFAARAQKSVTGLSTQAEALLLRHRWPGNVRELENCIECAVTLCRNDLIDVDDLPPPLAALADAVVPDDRLRAPAAGDDEEEGSALPSMEEVERRHIRRVLRAVHGNKSQAAAVLGFDRRTLYRKLKLYGDFTGSPRHP